MLNQPEWCWNYAKRLREVLLEGAADYHVARIVCLPSFEPEWVVTVVREEPKEHDGRHTYYVECVVADKKLYPPEKSQGATAKKTRTSLDSGTTEALNRVWRRMLRMTRYPKQSRDGKDGVNFHFSRFLPSVDCGRPDALAGWEQGTIWSPAKDSLCGEFVAIGNHLKVYAEARPEDREKVRLEIRARAANLGKRLEHAQPER
jgi:hypothetical protein